MQQVSKDHYKFGKYTKIDRWSSYFYQIKEVLETGSSSVLEIGVGEGVLRDYLKSNTKISYKSLDIASDLNPDFVGVVTKMPFKDSEFDAVCAFEVLEHIPYDDFPKALQEIFRVSRKNVILSLPHFGPPVLFKLKIPFLSTISFSFKIPFYKEHKFDGEHHWEIGKKGFSLKNIIKEINLKGKIIKEYVPFENQYHHFFVIKKYE